MSTLIKADDAWSLWAILIGWAAVSIWLEQKYNWASKISGAVLALLGALVLANLKIIPTVSPVYDNVWGYVVPVAIPLLLFKANINKIFKESGRMILAFWFPAVGTCVGAIVATVLLHNIIPQLGEIGGMMTASYIGGGVNFVAMTTVFHPEESLINATVVADNLVMAAFFFVYLYIPTTKFFTKRFRLAYPNANTDASTKESQSSQVAAYWGRKEVSLKDIALAMGSAVIIAAVSKKIGVYFGGVIPDKGALSMLNIMLSNQYFLMTTITVTLVSCFPKFFEKINGTQEIGTFLIYIFFVVIGAPASITEILYNTPMLFVFCIIIAVFNLLFSLIGAKTTKLTLEEMMLASNATVGGPTTAAAMAISRGWSDLVIPSLLCGLTGYILGNYFGLLIGNLLIKMF